MEGLWGLGLGLVETGLALAIFFVLVRRGWPGEDDDCIARDDCHCERICPGGDQAAVKLSYRLSSAHLFHQGSKLRDEILLDVIASREPQAHFLGAGLQLQIEF